MFSEKRSIGEGHFGKVFCSNYSNKGFFAIKLIKYSSNTVLNEIALLNILKRVKNIPNLIKVEEIKKRNLILQNLFGPSLEKLHFYFTEFTILNLAINLIKIFERNS